MEETLRRNYLHAMEIPVWLPRNSGGTLPRVEEATVLQPAFVTQHAQYAAGIPNVPLSTVKAMPIPQSVPIEPITKPATLVQSESSPISSTPPPPLQSQVKPAALPAAYPGDEGTSWEELAAKVAQCQACQELVANRSRTVFGVGNRHARLLVVGEAPGVDEDRQGEPFVGRAGQMLNAMLSAIGLQREEIYIANILKCRPPNNRTPHQDEARRCEPWLLRQIELLAPALILAAGQVAAQNLLKTQTSVGQLRGRIHEYGSKRIPVVVTYHPSYLLRAPGQKAQAWKDLQLLARMLRQG